MKYHNYSISDILKNKNEGVNTPEMISLYEEIDKYKNSMDNSVEFYVQEMNSSKPENAMRWVQENVPKDIRQYVCCALLGKEVNVLKRTERKYKTVADLGLEMVDERNAQVQVEEWFEHWNKQADMMTELKCNVYESHAHYNLSAFNKVRERLLELMFSSGVKKIVIPAVEYTTNQNMVDLFDKPEYEQIIYAFGSHPKYLWKENWTPEKWEEFRSLIRNNPKCIAIGETGLDYSYTGFCDKHRINQMNMFVSFIDEANQYNLPMILHIRPADENTDCKYDANEDALEILSKNTINKGAILHCFGGNISSVERYMSVGVNLFGIGGRIIYDNPDLENAVALMPETSIVLETDAPFIKVDGGRMPNTSLSLIKIAEKVAKIRGTTTEHILDISYSNAAAFFEQ